MKKNRDIPNSMQFSSEISKEAYEYFYNLMNEPIPIECEEISFTIPKTKKATVWVENKDIYIKISDKGDNNV